VNGKLSEQTTWERGIEGRESGLLPTPNAWDGQRGATSREMTLSGKHQVNLLSAVKHNLMPKMFPTPVKDDVHHRKEKYQQGGTALSTQAGGQLNPTWVCWLMGYPQDWVDIGTENQTSQELQQESKTESVNLKDSETP
jgi:hypothetical protein